VNARAAARIVAANLAEAGIPEAQFEAELLVRMAGSLTRSQYFANPELRTDASATLCRLLERRLAREPTAYISGTREFYGLDFTVTPAVLIPRPETELLVDLALSELESAPAATVVDVGTGSGCVAIAIAANAPNARVIALDLSRNALSVAQRNAARHAPRVQFVRSNLASALRGAEIVVANLPYIPTAGIPELDPEVARWEPRLALDGGQDGLDLVRELVTDCAERLRPRLLALEVGLGQAPRVACLGRSAGAKVETIRDLAGIERVVCLRWA
jgi:release factor glutamine methyltransferase